MNCANHPDRERVAFCQNCGKPLCTECSRAVGNAIFCEPCLAARLAAADAAASTGTPYNNVNVPPAQPSRPNPALAGLLGLIPGVGAMYNGQYAKGVVHIIIFAVLVNLSHVSDTFGLFVAGWIFYQMIEAHHTARARRDGTSLPNPFGLNDIGEKWGFGKSWSAGATAYPPPPPSPSTPNVGTDGPVSSSTQASGDTQTFVGNEDSHFTQGTQWSQSYTGSQPPPVPPIPPYGDSFSPGDPSRPLSQNRFPVGAILLIAFGVLFFIGSTGWFHHFPIHRIIPFLLIAMGVWIFIRKMTSSGQSMADDGSPAYRMRLVRALRGAAWVVMVGVLYFLDSFDILSWAHSWPLFIIVIGLMMLFERSTYSSISPAPYFYPPAGPSSAPFVPTQATGTTIIPSTSHDEEGR